MNVYPTVLIFRFVLVVTGTVVLNDLVFEQRDGPQALIAVTVFVGLWLFASLCSDARDIRRRLLSLNLDLHRGIANPSSPPIPLEKTDASKSLFEGVSIRDPGNRVFRADAVRTCENCQLFIANEMACDLDGKSLEGVTIVAVGCEDWSPGPNVTENDTADSEENGSPDDEA